MPRPWVRPAFLVCGWSFCAYWVIHMLAQASALWGDEAHQTACQWADGGVVRGLAPVFLVSLALGGAAVLLRRPKPARKGLPGDGRVWVAGMAACLLLLHVLHVKAPRWRGVRGGQDISVDLVSSLSSTYAGLPLLALVYCFGAIIGALCFAWAFSELLEQSGCSPRWSVRLGWATGTAGLLVACASVVRLATGAPPW